MYPRLGLPGAARERTLSLDGTALTVDGLAFRPNGRRLYGYSEEAGAVYEIDPTTGEATFAAGLGGLVLIGRRRARMS